MLGLAACILIVLAVPTIGVVFWFVGSDSPTRSTGRVHIEAIDPDEEPKPKLKKATLPALPDEIPPRVLKPGVADALKNVPIPTRLRELAGGGHADKAPAELVAVFGEDNWLLPHGNKGGWMDVSPDGQLLAVPSNDTVAIFDTVSGKHQRTLTGIGGQVTTAVFSPDGKRLAIGSMGGDSVIRLIDVATWNEVGKLSGSKYGVQRLAFSADGKQLASVGGEGDKKGEAIIWDVASLSKQKDLFENAFMVRNVAFSPDGAVVATASDGPRVRIWDAVTGNLLKTLPLRGKSVAYGLAFSHDGKYLAGGTSSESIIWTTANWSLHDTWNYPGEWLAFQGKTEMLLAAAANPQAKQTEHLMALNAAKQGTLFKGMPLGRRRARTAKVHRSQPRRPCPFQNRL